MKGKLFGIIFGGVMLVSQAGAEIITAKPLSLGCTLSGTGAGTCDIVFPDNTITSCANKTRVNFNPQTGVLGEQVYSMVLAAVSADIELTIGTLPCNELGKAEIDSISYSK